MILSDPLSDATKLVSVRSIKEVVFASDLQSAQDLLLADDALLSALRNCLFDLHVIRENTDPLVKEAVLVTDALHEFPSSTKYLFEHEGSKVVYDSPRDALCVIFLDERLSEDGLSLLDSRFREHIQDVGIGFGEEGRRYFSALLRSIEKTGLIAEDRRAGLLA